MLLVVPPAHDIDAVLEWMVALTAMSMFDVRQKLLRGLPFLLHGPQSHGQWAVHLTLAGLPAYEVPDAIVSENVRVIDAARFSFGSEGLQVRAADGAEATLPADQIELIVHAHKDTAGTKGRGPECLYLLCAQPSTIVRFTVGAFDGAGLGARRTGVARQDYLLVRGIVQANATAAVVDERLSLLAAAVPATQREQRHSYVAHLQASEGPLYEAALLLCIARRMQRAT